MKCALIFVSLIALGCAVPLLQEASIRIAVADDDTISIFGTAENKLVISRVLEHSGPRNVEIFAGFKDRAVKRILLDQETTVDLANPQYQTGLTEADILVHIFKNYQGYVDVNTYTNLLRQIHTHVQSGHVSMAVYNILKSFVVLEVSWEQHVTSDADMTESVSPRWYSLLNRLGLKGEGFGFTQTTSNDVGAVPLQASIRIDVAVDGTISIYGATGNKLVISRVLEHYGSKNVEVFLGVEQGTMKRILMDQETSVEFAYAQYQTGLTEADILVHIFKNYQGYVDVNTYTNLLRQVHTHVQSGHVRMAVFNILKSFIVREVSWERLVTPEAHMVDYTSPKWYSLFNRLGLKGTGKRFAQINAYDSDYPTAELRDLVGQPGYIGQVVPEQYYANDVDSLTGQIVEPGLYPFIQQQQPMYQRAQQKNWYPQQLTYMNAPVLY